MAKVFAPLLSLSASGTVANELTYSKGKYFHYLKNKNILKKKVDFQTPGRLEQRARFLLAKNAWLALDTETKEAYNRLRYPTGQTGYNIFLSRYLLQEENLSNFPYLLALSF